jgi:hypothetical protein
VGLVDGGDVGVEGGDGGDSVEEGLACAGVGEGGDHVGDVVAVPVGVGGVVATGVEGEDLLEDVEVVGDVEGVAAVLVAEEVVEVVVAAPRDGGQAERAGLVGGHEDALAGGGHGRPGPLVQALDGVHLSVPERILHLVVGLRDHQGQVRLPQDRRAEHLVAPLHLAARLGRHIALDHIQQPGYEPCPLVVHSQSSSTSPTPLLLGIQHQQCPNPVQK